MVCGRFSVVIIFLEMAFQSWVLGQPIFISGSKLLYIARENRPKRMPMEVLAKISRYPYPFVSNCVGPCTSRSFSVPRYGDDDQLFGRARLRCLCKSDDYLSEKNSVSKAKMNFILELLKRGVILAATICGVLAFGCWRVSAIEGAVNAGYGVFGQSILLLRNTWPKVLQVLRLFKEQGLVLVVLLGLSAFFSLAETSITTLWPWKVSVIVLTIC